MNIILFFLVGVFTVFNIIISGFMTYKMIVTAFKCKCAVMNAYWFLIFLYFVFSGVFLIFTLLVLFKLMSSDKMIHWITAYVLGTLIFAVGSVFYTKYLKGKDCNCIEHHYTQLLHTITYFRFGMAIITGISLLVWSVYVLLMEKKK
jgi:hypothetical protein